MLDIAPHASRSRAGLVAACLVAIVAVIALSATGSSAHAQGAQTNSVSASIAYTDGSKSKTPLWKNIRITIKRGSETVLQSELLPEAARESEFAAPKLLAVDLNDDGEAEVIVDVYTSGKDCCRRSVIYQRDGDSYKTELVAWTGTGYRLDDVLGKSSPEFLTTDARFPRLYDESSDARGPIRVLSYRGGKLKDLSDRARSELRRDARIQWRTWRSVRRKGGDARPAVAAYVADLVRLGDVREARAVIANAAANDELKVSRASFTRTLDRKLVTWGYTEKRVLTRR